MYNTGPVIAHTRSSVTSLSRLRNTTPPNPTHSPSLWSRLHEVRMRRNLSRKHVSEKAWDLEREKLHVATRTTSIDLTVFIVALSWPSRVVCYTFWFFLHWYLAGSNCFRNKLSCSFWFDGFFCLTARSARTELQLVWIIMGLFLVQNVLLID